MEERSILYWIVNGITISRSLLSLAAISLVATRDPSLMTVGLLTTGVAVSLDLVDGNLARLWNVRSREGAHRDAIADVTMVTAGLMGVGLALEQTQSICWMLLATGITSWFTFVRWQQVRNEV